MEPRPTTRRLIGMTTVRTMLALLVAAGTITLVGCGTESADDPASGAGTPVMSGGSTDGASSDPDAETEIGTVLINERLAVSPAEYPLPDVPTHVEVADADELRQAFATVPGIDEIVAKAEAELNAAGRLFAYTTNACITDDVSLQVNGTEVPMIIHGTSTIRCQPPTTLVVWAVGDQVPADAVPAQPIQK